MISVPNRLLLLSGNSYRSFLFTFCIGLIGFSACKTSSKASTGGLSHVSASRTTPSTVTNKVEVAPKTELPKKVVAETAPKVVKKENRITFDTINTAYSKILIKSTYENNVLVSTERVKEYPKIQKASKRVKGSYNVVILLPFMTHLMGPSGVPSKSKMAIEYYTGMKVAFKSLQEEGISLNVKVYDEQADTSVVARLLESSELHNADLILGPVSSNNLLQVSNFSRVHGIPMISPLSSKDVSVCNPNFFQINPSVTTHCETAVRYALTQSASPNVIVITRPFEEELEYGERIEDNFIIQDKLGRAKIEKVVMGTDSIISFSNIEAKLSNSADNFIFVSTLANEAYLLSLFSSLKQHPDKKITVFGLPKWNSIKDKSIFSGINTIITDDIKETVNSESESYKAFRLYFTKQNHYPPGEFNVKGFDHMLFVGRILNKYGTGLSEAFDSGYSTSLLLQRFAFKPTYQIYPTTGTKSSSQAVVRGYENKDVRLKKFNGSSFSTIN